MGVPDAHMRRTFEKKLMRSKRTHNKQAERPAHLHARCGVSENGDDGALGRLGQAHMDRRIAAAGRI